MSYNYISNTAVMFCHAYTNLGFITAVFTPITLYYILINNTILYKQQRSPSRCVHIDKVHSI